VNILNLCEHLAERSVVGYQALGWLAHEGRISYRRQGSQVYVSLAARMPRDMKSETGKGASQ
jgi:tRNA 2-selenouridine synthase SelU